jgi:hypothetical protein
MKPSKRKLMRCMYVKSRALEKPKGASKLKQGLECNDVRRVLLSVACAPCRERDGAMEELPLNKLGPDRRGPHTTCMRERCLRTFQTSRLMSNWPAL